MIIVKVELHSAITGRTTQLGRMHICNDGTSESPNFGDYLATVLRKPDFSRTTRSAYVLRYARQRRVIWDLVSLALRNMGYG